MNKFNKGKLIGVVAAALSTVSLMGVGFASWIITGTSPITDVGNIDVTVGDIQDKRVVFDGTPTITKGKLVFDADGTKKSGGLVAAGDQTKKEDMEFTVKYKVKVYTAAASNWKVNAKLVDNNNGGLAAAVSHKYIAYPTASAALDLTEKAIFESSMIGGTTAGITLNTTTETSTEYHTYEVTQTFTFTWGTAFKNVNPVEVKEGDDIYTGTSANSGIEKATTDLLVTNLQGLKGLSFTGLKLQLSTALKTA